MRRFWQWVFVLGAIVIAHDMGVSVGKQTFYSRELGYIIKLN